MCVSKRMLNSWFNMSGGGSYHFWDIMRPPLWVPAALFTLLSSSWHSIYGYLESKAQGCILEVPGVLRKWTTLRLFGFMLTVIENIWKACPGSLGWPNYFRVQPPSLRAPYLVWVSDEQKPGKLAIEKNTGMAWAWRRWGSIGGSQATPLQMEVPAEQEVQGRHSQDLPGQVGTHRHCPRDFRSEAQRQPHFLHLNFTVCIILFVFICTVVLGFIIIKVLKEVYV